MKESITDKQFINSYRSAGLWFVALYMEEFLLRVDELDDDLLKNKLIEEIYDNGENTFDKEISGTRTRVNALYRIIKAGRVIEALEIAINSKRLKKSFLKQLVRQKTCWTELIQASLKYSYNQY